MSDYFDSVREEACIACEYMIQNFIPTRNDLPLETTDFLKMLRAQITIGWNDQFSVPLRDICKEEGTRVAYLFADV